MGQHVEQYFQKMWKCNDPLVDEWLLQHQGHGITVSQDEALDAVKVLRFRAGLDCFGCCPSSLLLLASAAPVYLADVLTDLAKSPNQWKSMTICGKVKAKALGPVTAAKLRTILPLPALVGALDVIIAKRLNDIAENLTADVGFGFLEAAKRHQQVLDITFPASLA